jgi:hypothetical protein
MSRRREIGPEGAILVWPIEIAAAWQVFVTDLK